MKQSRSTSFLKSCVSTVVGFGVAFAANMIILPLFGLPISHSANLVLTSIYTAISIARGYALERLFEAMGWRTRMSAFALAVLAERQRQITHEGWTPEHDDCHDVGDLARASAAYILDDETMWPWHPSDFKPDDGWRRSLVKGTALALALGEKVDRNRKPKRAATNVPWEGSYQGSPGPKPPAPTTASGVRPADAGVTARSSTPARQSLEPKNPDPPPDIPTTVQRNFG
jgi:hypothetical protein